MAKPTLKTESLKTPVLKLSREEQKKAALEHQKANELIHQLVVKIISWKSGSSQVNKITTREWTNYRQHILRISKTESPDRVKGKLEATKEAIQNHGGFDF